MLSQLAGNPGDDDVLLLDNSENVEISDSVTDDDETITDDLDGSLTIPNLQQEQREDENLSSIIEAIENGEEIFDFVLDNEISSRSQ